ncbi:MAG: hypothetical protein LLF76_15645 [Planctomycetaceae bacterium]|nr:hypothetical protein [Planctomycetaceae bacterium]
MPDTIKKAIRCYLAQMLEGQLGEAEFVQLGGLLEGNSQAQEYYLDLLDIGVALRKLDWTVETEQAGMSDILNRELWSALSDTEKNAPSIELRSPVLASPEPLQKLAVPKSPRRISRLSLAAVFTSVAAMLLMLAYVHFSSKTQGEQAAVLKDSIGAVWGDSSFSPPPGHVISTRDKTCVLLAGTVKIESLLGPEMIIEGPSLFEFPDMNKVLLHSGRIYVNVPKNAIGYTVRAPSFSVIDLGTQFGVSIDADGSGDVFMFSGKASLVSGAQGQTSGSHMLTEGTAKRVYAIDGQVEDIAFSETRFVRQIDSQQGLVWRGESVNLADMVGGGNGFGRGKIGTGIEPVHGTSGAFQVPAEAIQQGAGEYVPLGDHGFVDGVFVPDGGRGPVQVSSQGHTFDACPDTEGVYWMPVMNGGLFAHYPGAPQNPLRLGAAECGTAAHPAIFLHSNLGVTFDLRAIRNAVPATEIDEFQAQCGISSTGPQRFPCADLWVLVDGKVRFSRRGVGGADVHSIDIPIYPGDQFLTLAATDGGREICLSDGSNRYPIDSDWCVFAQPRLTLQPKTEN